jgi:hypothetical protein
MTCTIFKSWLGNLPIEIVQSDWVLRINRVML